MTIEEPTPDILGLILGLGMLFKLTDSFVVTVIAAVLAVVLGVVHYRGGPRCPTTSTPSSAADTPSSSDS